VADAVALDERIASKCRELGIGEPDFSTAPGEYNAERSDAHVLPGAVVDSAVYATAVPSVNGQWFHQGTLGDRLTVEEGYAAAGLAAISALLEIRHVLGGFERLERIALVIAYVTSAPGFIEQPLVANGASDMFEELLGERGRHARAAIGCTGMVGGHCIELVVTAVASPDGKEAA
jgi:enamine deaminase RidA (YjgF/YER057c/UK114 family)